mmetsp:Transcript_61481/g.176343  ORF Transcript_61481/g.176343 Transcript_61481/m.176343 type:complete len:344 (-) Transcript_61481:1334-2365(-)
MLVECVATSGGHPREDVHPQDAEQDEEQERHDTDVCQLHQGDPQGAEELVQGPERLELQQLQDPRDPEDTADRGHRGDVDASVRDTQDDASDSSKDAREIEHIPSFLPIVPLEREQLEDGLNREHGYKSIVRPRHEVSPPRGVRRLQLGEGHKSHEHGVENDAGHDESFEEPVLHDVVNLSSPRRQQVQVLQVENSAAGTQRHSRLQPSPLGGGDVVLPLCPHLHELVDNDTDTEVHQEHETEQDPHHKHEHPDGGVRVAQRLHVRGERGVARRVHDIHPALGRRDLDKREHGVEDVVEVLAEHLLPLSTLLHAQGSIFDQRSAEIRALARCLVLLSAGLTRP